MKNLMNKIITGLVIIAGLALFAGCDMFIKTNDGKVDLAWYMHLTYEDKSGVDQPCATKVGDSVAAVALEKDYSTEYGIIIGEDAFVNIDTVKNNIDDRFYWDKKENLVMFTNATDIYSNSIGENNINEETVDYTVAFVENKKCYINTKFLKKFVDMKCEINKKTKEAPAIISMIYSNDEKTRMTLDDDIEMRTKGDYQNLIVADVQEDTKVTIIENGENWTKVRMDNGYIGFVPTKYLDDKETVREKFKTDDDRYTHVTLDKKVCMGWNQVYNQDANNNIGSILKKSKGLNVISPTWFSIEDKRGNISSLASLAYVETAHNNGVQVWALINDFKDRKLTKTVLTSTSIRQRLVDNIMYYLDRYQLDGINIDFEYISQDIGDSYLQFLREMSIECRKAGKVFSIDNYAPSEWSLYYDRGQQALIADYVIIMNYDEHTVGSTKAGSVASIAYTEKSIKDTLDQTGNADRIINGMPFYTRVWIETPEQSSDGSGIFIEDSVNGNYYLDTKAVTMDSAKEAYTDAGVKPSFDEASGQNYVSYSVGDSVYSIWLEDETSVKARLDLVNKYQLGGVAYWALGQENEKIWNTIEPYFK